MAENDEATFNTSQPELLHMLWNLAVCCLSLMRKVICSSSFFRFLTCFLLGGQQRHTFSPTPLVLPSVSQSNVEILISKPLLGFYVCGLFQILHRQFRFWIRRADRDCSLVSFLTVPGSESIKSVECKTSILCYGLIFQTFTTNILTEVAAEQKDVNERIKAKDNGWEHLEDISVMLRVLDVWNRDKRGSSKSKEMVPFKKAQRTHTAVFKLWLLVGLAQSLGLEQGQDGILLPVGDIMLLL